MNKQKSGNLLAIIVMILLFGMISFVTNLASPMGDVLKNQFGVANWMGTLGVFANFIAYVGFLDCFGGEYADGIRSLFCQFAVEHNKTP